MSSIRVTLSLVAQEALPEEVVEAFSRRIYEEVRWHPQWVLGSVHVVDVSDPEGRSWVLRLEYTDMQHHDLYISEGPQEPHDGQNRLTTGPRI